THTPGPAGVTSRRPTTRCGTDRDRRNAPSGRALNRYPSVPMPERTKADPRHRSREVTEGPARAPARAMLRAVGFTEEDFTKPQIGVASSWNEVTPCNYFLNRVAQAAK